MCVNKKTHQMDAKTPCWNAFTNHLSFMHDIDVVVSEKSITDETVRVSYETLQFFFSCFVFVLLFGYASFPFFTRLSCLIQRVKTLLRYSSF